MLTRRAKVYSSAYSQIFLVYLQPFCRNSLMGCLHDPANIQQTSSKCIKNTRANAGSLLDVC